MNKLSIIIPIYYNADTLMACYEDLRNKVLHKFEDYEIIMVDDGSQDKSWTVMKKIKEIDSKCILVKLSRNFGAHAAVLAGLSVSTGDCATIKSADLQEDSELIVQMYEEWSKKNDVVLAVREKREDGISQKLFANMYYWLVQKMALERMPSTGFDCFLIDRKVIDVLVNLNENNSSIELQVLWAGFRTSRVSYIRKKRKVGKSKWTLGKKIKLVIDSLIGFSFTPIRFMTYIGAICFLGSIVWGIILIIGKIVGNIGVEGWTTLMVMQLFSSGLMMFTLGILGEYIWRTLDAARKRPVYIIEKLIADTGVQMNEDTDK